LKLSSSSSAPLPGAGCRVSRSSAEDISIWFQHQVRSVSRPFAVRSSNLKIVTIQSRLDHFLRIADGVIFLGRGLDFLDFCTTTTSQEYSRRRRALEDLTRTSTQLAAAEAVFAKAADEAQGGWVSIGPGLEPPFSSRRATSLDCKKSRNLTSRAGGGGSWAKGGRECIGPLGTSEGVQQGEIRQQIQMGANLLFVQFGWRNLLAGLDDMVG
jgi:hypothetical protein